MGAAKSGSHLHLNISSVPYLQSHVHSQFLQLLPCILVYHPILQNRESCAIMKIQKRSESNVLSKPPLQNCRKQRLSK